MREIKLKFWDKVLNCWSGGSHHLITAGKFAWAPEEGNRYISVQYTGLKDKNGKDIYEGDIVKRSLGKHYWVGVIECASKQFGNTLFYMGRFSNCGSSDEMWNWEVIEYKNRDYVPSGRDCKVIGNIYENPELLD